MTIYIDAMGGDNAPKAIIEGALMAKSEFNAPIALIGDVNTIENCLAGRKDASDIEIIPATESIGMHEEPVKAVRQKKDSSLVKGALLAKESYENAFISAGSTGALLAAALLYTGRIKGIQRPAICTAVDILKPMAILDNGANADCKPEYFPQFAKLGAAYISALTGEKRPAVALLNIGTEETKGSELYKAAHELLVSDESINFIGNVEASGVLTSEADVIVCDGFAGNVFLKATEGSLKFMGDMLKDVFYQNIFTKLSALGVKKAITEKKAKLDPKTYGGSPFLGVNGNVIKAHGNSDALAIRNAVLQAMRMISEDVLGKIYKTI